MKEKVDEETIEYHLKKLNYFKSFSNKRVIQATLEKKNCI